MEIKFTSIGVIHTPIHDKAASPIQAARSEIEGTVEVLPEYAEGLEGIEDFSHIFLLYTWHQADSLLALKVKPYLDDQEHGLFTTRFPVRPNSLGFSVVRLLGREGNLLHFRGADMLDGTPLLDIKPYLPDFDVFTVSRIGWYQQRKFK
ncbi:MAG: tRNA (N6-threonylcarbamoyladenosine(37)-N6)-methyltransferase TrmO [Anaerolineaceae bacterium]|nr:tRNA (N6-threonylcarbamoyladenosine(37)-N6)-methyltransferase TrmO [Anaerolineaceae bacterium]